MDDLSVLVIAMTYLALLFFWVGLGYRVWLWATTPVPLRIPTTPAPTTSAGAAVRVAGEFFLFRSLWRENLPLWFGGWSFHVALLLVLLKHLRYMTYPIPGWVNALFTVGEYAGWVMVFALTFLFFRRIVLERIRYISLLSDYLVLVLIVSIPVTGLWMKYLDPVFIVQSKAFVLGIITLSPQPVPHHWLFLLHFSLVLLLMFYFPASKLMHGAGIFFSPTRTMANKSREQRHINPWDYPTE